MKRGDRVVIWTGGGSGYRGPWGVLAFATIVDRSVASAASEGWISLSNLERFEPITPFDVDIRPSQRSEHSDFLSDLFGAEFQPLHKVFNELGYPAGDRKAVLAWKLDPVEFWAPLRRAKRLYGAHGDRKAA